MRKYVRSITNKLGLVAGAALMAAPTFAAAAADAATVEKVQSVSLTVTEAIVILITIVTAGIGVRLYKKLGNRAVGSV